MNKNSHSIKVGLIGVGGVGGLHLQALTNLETEGPIRLVAVADPTADRMGELKQQLTQRGVRWHLDYLDMLQAEELDAVVIAAPIHLHYEMALACIERGLFVLLEKPPVPLIQQLDTLIKKDTHNRVSVGFQMITSRTVERLKAAIVQGELGAISSIRACACWPRLDKYYNRASWAGKLSIDGKPVFDGPATNALAHLTHNIMFLASTQVGGFETPIEVEGELYRARRIESYDVAALRGQFANGIEFSAALTHATERYMPFRLEVHGSEGWARLSDDGALLEGSSMERMYHPESTLELIERSHGQWIDSIQGKLSQVATRLRDTRGYVLTTNGMLLSCGKIRSIDANLIRTFSEDVSSGFDVTGLYEAVEQSGQTSKLYSELGLPWAVRPKRIKLDHLKHLDLPVNGMEAVHVAAPLEQAI